MAEQRKRVREDNQERHCIQRGRPHILITGPSDRSLPNPTPNLHPHTAPESVPDQTRPPNNPLDTKRLRHGRLDVEESVRPPVGWDIRLVKGRIVDGWSLHDGCLGIEMGLSCCHCLSGDVEDREVSGRNQGP